MQYTQDVLLFIVLAVNFNQFQELHTLTLAACSYTCAVGYYR